MNNRFWVKTATVSAIAMCTAGVLLRMEPSKAADILFGGTLTGVCTVTPGTTGTFTVQGPGYLTLSTNNTGGAAATVSASVTTPGTGVVSGPRLNFVVPTTLATKPAAAPAITTATVDITGATPATSSAAGTPLVLPFALGATEIPATDVDLTLAAGTAWINGEYTAVVVVTCLGAT